MDNPLDFGYDRQIVIDQHHIIVALLKSSPGMCFREGSRRFAIIVNFFWYWYSDDDPNIIIIIITITYMLKSSPGMCFREWGVGLQLAELALKIENTNTISSQTMVYKLHYCTH